jgi:hypothetical protein
MTVDAAAPNAFGAVEIIPDGPQATNSDVAVNIANLLFIGHLRAFDFPMQSVDQNRETSMNGNNPARHRGELWHESRH